MAAITSVEIEGFRCFKRLRVAGLSPVTLIVGANNSGKTALLEAIEGGVSPTNPFAFYRGSYERGEFRRRGRMDVDPIEIDLRHWFAGHRLEVGARFDVRAHGSDGGIETGRAIGGAPEGSTASPSLWVTAGALDAGGRVNASVIRGTNLNGSFVTGVSPNLPLTPDGFLGGPPGIEGHGFALRPPVGFITTDRQSAARLSLLWNAVVLKPEEALTEEAVRIVEPAIERIAIAEGEGGAKVLLRGAKEPVPLGTLGEGVSRILALALHLAVVRGGYLFVDEIENGIHWSAMPKIWRFLVASAQRLDVQVFATTHSKDCIEGLGELHRTHPDLAARVSVHRLEAGRETSVRFSADRIAEYVEMELEAR